MHPWWRARFEEQQRSGFADLAGARASLRLPIAETLLNQAIAEWLPERWPVRELMVHALANDELAVRVRPRSDWLPPVQVRFAIEGQPVLPENPVLRLRLLAGGVSAFAGFALAALSRLPPGLQFADDRLTVDLAVLARSHGLEQWLPLLTALEITTEPGRLIVSASAGVRPVAAGQVPAGNQHSPV